MSTTIVTQHDLNEWVRMARAAYASGHNEIGHRYSVAAATIKAGADVDVTRFDALQAAYRAWLVFGEYV